MKNGMKFLPKPEPVIIARSCSICGLPWDDHGEEPEIMTCVELLKAALEKSTPRFATGGIVTSGIVNPTPFHS